MARLPSSFRQKNRTTESFRALYAKLPSFVQEACRSTCLIFDKDPTRNSLRTHTLSQNSRGNHKDGSVSVSISMTYRAIYVKGSDGKNVWYWIGTHADYDKFTGG
jgi:hypothetical protein